MSTSRDLQNLGVAAFVVTTKASVYVIHTVTQPLNSQKQFEDVVERPA